MNGRKPLTLTALDRNLTHPTAAEQPHVRTVRDDIDSLHAEFLSAARNTARLAKQLDLNDSHAAGGHARAAVGHIWRAAEELHTAFHHAPPRGTGPFAPLSRLCARRMRYLAARAARNAS
ncbi:MULTISPECIES: DUF6238 family protein [Streptomyces]|uniref:DUF6238 family protein n=1 Tax=Streptomyces TaxID=1883 RepID=UPI000B9EBC30|nr:DUF6238 family protein [Streptomyces kasugaensis]